jgi:hypothetical protein
LDVEGVSMAGQLEVRWHRDRTKGYRPDSIMTYLEVPKWSYSAARTSSPLFLVKPDS